MHIIDFGGIVFTSANMKDKIEYRQEINPDGDLLLGVAAMAELKFSLYDLQKLIPEDKIVGKEFAFKKAKAFSYNSKWDIFKIKKPDMLCLNGDTMYWTKKGVFYIDDSPVADQPTDEILCIYMVNSIVYLGHSRKVTAYTLQGVKQGEKLLSTFEQTQIDRNRTLNMQGNILREYSIELRDLKPFDFVEKIGEYKQVGLFKAISVQRKSGSNIEVTAYDRMNNFAEIADSFVAELNFPITTFNMLKALCTFVGVTLQTTAITNGGYSIDKKFAVTGTTARTLLQWLAETSGNFAYINSDGKLIVDFYKPSMKSYTKENFRGIRQEQYTTAKIDKLQIKVQTDDIGVIIGSGTNAYVIENNPLLYTRSIEEIKPIAQALFDKLKDFAYIPTDFSTVLDNVFECDVGEIITIEGTATPIMTKRVLGLIETYTSTGGAVRGTQVTRQNQYLQMLSGKTNEIIADIDKFSVTLTDVKNETEKNSAQILVQAGQISSKVSQTDYNGNTISSLINQTATTIKIQAQKLELTGYVTLTNLSTPGQTIINGGNIITGTISSDRLSSDVVTTGRMESSNVIVGGIQFGNDYQGEITVNPQGYALELRAEGMIRFFGAGRQSGSVTSDGTITAVSGFRVGSSYGADGSFTDKNGNVITVVGGIITSI